MQRSRREDRVRHRQRARRRPRPAGDRRLDLLQRHGQRRHGPPRRRDRRRHPAPHLGQRGRRPRCSATASTTCGRCPSTQLFPTLEGGELKLLLRRERAARMTLPVRTASGAIAGGRASSTTPSPGGRMWTAARHGDRERAGARAPRHRRRPRAALLRPDRALADPHAALGAGHAAGARQRRVLHAGRPARRAAPGHRLDRHASTPTTSTASSSGSPTPSRAARSRSRPAWCATTAPTGRRSSGSPTCSPPASAPASSARSRTSPTGWPSRPRSPTRPTTTR